MKLREYFLKGLELNLCNKRHWVNSLFTECLSWDEPGSQPRYPMQLYKDPQGKLWFDNAGEPEYLEDQIPGRLPLHFRDAFELKPGDISNYRGTETVITTYGNVFYNHLCQKIPFGDLFDFPLGICKTDTVESTVEAKLLSNPTNGDTETMAPDGNFYVWQLIKFMDATLVIPGYSDTLVTSITKKSMTAHPGRNELRAQLMEKYKDRLHDPVAIAQMTVEFKALDKEYRKGDETEEFYNASKKAEDTRMKVYYHFGGESAFSDGTSVQYISKSLEEGLDTDNMDVMNNALRFGSYNRGAQTALGGESTKTIYRMVGTARIIMEDCETQLGVPTDIRKDMRDTLIGLSIIEAGKTILLTAENIESYYGKNVQLRGPFTCKAGEGKGKNVCAVCMGKQVAENPNGIPAAAAGVGGRFLTAFLKKMHASSLKTTRMILRDRIT